MNVQEIKCHFMKEKLELAFIFYFDQFTWNMMYNNTLAHQKHGIKKGQALHENNPVLPSLINKPAYSSV